MLASSSSASRGDNVTSDHQILERREHFAASHRRDFQRRAARLAPVRSTERKLATVLFVDVQSSMNLSAAIELEEWWSILTGLFELMGEGVCRCGGWVGSFTGDGIKGVFEAPDAAEAHARGACDAALWLRDALRRPAAELLDERGLELAVRIGINSGEVVTGTIGDRYGRFYTATGYAVALAKRIEALALPGRVYVSEHTAALVDRTHQLRSLGSFSVKGAQLPVGVFELMEGGR